MLEKLAIEIAWKHRVRISVLGSNLVVYVINISPSSPGFDNRHSQKNSLDVD